MISPGAFSSRDKILSWVLGGLLAIELAILIWLAKFDLNEGWYALYPSLVLNGQVPYRDFFYHRLPLLPFFFIPSVWFPLSMLASIRVLCAACTWMAWWFSGLIAELWTGSTRSKTWVLILGLASFYGNSYLITAQSYGPFAMLAVLAIWLMSQQDERGASLRFFSAGLLFACAMGLRFGPDPLLIILPWAIIIQRWRTREGGKFLMLLTGFLLALACIFSFSAYWNLKSFLWSAFVWPFEVFRYIRENRSIATHWSLKEYLFPKLQFLTGTVHNYLPVLAPIFLGVLAGLQHRGYQIWKWALTLGSTELFTWILIVTNFFFFLFAQGSGVMQLTFVLPLAAACGVVLAQKGFTSFGWPTLSRSSGYVCLCALIATGLVGETPLSCSWRSPGTDVIVLSRMGEKLQKLIPANQYIVTFDPVLAANAHRRIYPGMEFELFGFFPKWDRATAERLKIYNWPMLKSSLTSPLTGVVVLTDRRWLDQEGMGRLLKPYQGEIVRTLEHSSYSKESINVPECVGLGNADIYSSPSESVQ